MKVGHVSITEEATRQKGFQPEVVEELREYVCLPDKVETVISSGIWNHIKFGYSGATHFFSSRWAPPYTRYLTTTSSYEPKHHFDRPPNFSSQYAFRESARYVELLVNVMIPYFIRDEHNYDKARRSLGCALHALQDFYAHSNFVDLSLEEQIQIEADLFSPTFPTTKLKLTGFTSSSDAGRPGADEYSHEAFCKDSPHGSPDAESLNRYGFNKFVAARLLANHGSIRLLDSLKVRLTPAEWNVLRGLAPGGLANGSLSVSSDSDSTEWSCIVPGWIGGFVTTECNGTIVENTGGTAQIDGNMVLGRLTDASIGSDRYLVMPDGRVAVGWRRLDHTRCTDTLTTQCPVRGRMRIQLNGENLNDVDFTDIAAYRWIDSLAVWEQVTSSTYDVGSRTLVLDFVSTGLFAIAARPLGHGELHVRSWDWLQDTFPASETVIPASAAFDTTAAYVKTGFNIAPPAYSNRMNIPGDTVVVRAPGGNVRVDLVFRIRPGPGNYVTIGNIASGLRRVPTGTIQVTPGDESFWGQYMVNPGEFSTPGASELHIGWPGYWNPNVWNSARIDTAEYNVFPVEGLGIRTPSELGRWMATYHESDPKFAALGIDRNRCFLADTTGSASWACDWSGGQYPPVWLIALPPSQTGWDGQTTTKEGTKILPDGLFTPGTHVEYFFRKTNLSTGEAFLLPDTNRVYPQYDAGSLDAHRWQTFSVLPDRWKDPAFGGWGMACLLVVDNADGGGDERVWSSIADSIQATYPNRFGAGNGWHAVSGQDLNDPATFVSAHLGQPGTSWDLYQVRGGNVPTGFPPAEWPVLSGPASPAAGTIGSRLVNQGIGPIGEKRSRQGPTPDMLGMYYRMLFMMTGDASDGILGPYWNRGQDDVRMLLDWLSISTPFNPRALWVMGTGFAESNANAYWGPRTQNPFMIDWLGVELRSGSYPAATGDLSDCINLYPTSFISPEQVWYGLHSGVGSDADILERYTGVPEAVVSSRYGDVGPGPFPLVSGVYKPPDYNSGRPWMTLVDGFSIQDLTTPYCANPASRNKYFYDVFQLFQSRLGCQIVGSPIYLDVPSEPAAPREPYLSIRNNPVRLGLAEFQIGLPQDGPVQLSIYDVAGRRVATLVDGPVRAGQHRVTWSGRQSAHVGAGVYFVRYSTSTYESSKKVVILR